MGIAHREPTEITVDQYDHGVIMMALAHLALERGDLAARAEVIAIRLYGHRMFLELRDLKLRKDRVTRNATTSVDRTARRGAEASRDEARDEAGT